MTRTQTLTLFPLVQSFFCDHLQHTRGSSPHTIRAYSDTLRLFFCFVADRTGRDLASLTLKDLDVDAVTAFLSHLEAQRHNSTSSRNHRLAAIRSFFKHLIRHDLTHSAQYQRVTTLPAKRARVPLARYLEPHDMRAIVRQPDCRTAAGQRDHALLLLLYNTGARVAEALNVHVKDLELSPPAQVRLVGKRRKERLCPLWRETAETLRRLPVVRSGSANDLIFKNQRGGTLTRDGVAYILEKHTARAAKQIPTLHRCHPTPHVLRHYVPRLTRSTGERDLSDLLGSLASSRTRALSPARRSLPASQVL